MNKETLEEAKTLQSNIEVLIDVKNFLDKGFIQIALTNSAGHYVNDGKLTAALPTDLPIIKRVTRSLLNDALTAEISKLEGMLENL